MDPNGVTKDDIKDLWKAIEDLRREVRPVDARMQELRTFIEARLQAAQALTNDKLGEVNKMLSNFLVENTRIQERVVSRTDALHSRLDQHQDQHSSIEAWKKEITDRLDKKDEDSKIIKKENRSWLMNLGAAAIIAACGALGTLVVLGFREWLRSMAQKGGNP